MNAQCTLTDRLLPAIVLMLVFIAMPLHAADAGIEVESLMKIDPSAPILDTAAGGDGKLIFVLTPGEVIVYTGADGKEIDRIPVGQAVTRLTALKDGRLILFGNAPPTLDILKVDRIYEIDTAGRAFKGGEDARIILAVFDDYQCPYCSRLESRLDQLVQDYGDQVKLVIKHFPIPSHRFAYRAAMAALAAGNQEKFWEFHAALFENFNALDDKKIQEIAESLSLDRERFEKDRNAPESRAIIIQDMQEGQRIGVRGTPTIFLNGKKVDNRDISRLPEMIDTLLEKQASGSKAPAQHAEKEAP
mgnify:CR=1 FL=1